jgi:hypothetical protein
MLKNVKLMILMDLMHQNMELVLTFIMLMISSNTFSKILGLIMTTITTFLEVVCLKIQILKKEEVLVALEVLVGSVGLITMTSLVKDLEEEVVDSVHSHHHLLVVVWVVEVYPNLPAQ